MRTFEEIRVDVNTALSVNDVDALQRLSEELRELGTSQAAAAAENALGAANSMLGDYAAAVKHYEQAVDMYRMLGDTAHLANVTTNMGNVYMSTGDYGRAMEHYRRALDVHEETGNRRSAANTICNIGTIYYLVGDFPAAVEYLQRARDMYEELDERAGVALVVGNIGGVFLETDDLASAMTHLRDALTIHEEIGDRPGAARVTANIGNVFQAGGDHAAAMECYRRALSEQEELGDRTGVANVLGNMIDLLLTTGSIDEASSLLDRQATLEIHEPQVHAKHAHNRAKVAEHTNDLDAANAYLERALAIVVDAGARSDAAQYHLALRDLAQKRNDFPGYIAHNNDYTRITEEIRGKEATQKLTMLEAEKHIAAERAEKEKHRSLLYNTLPPAIAERVLRGEQVNDSHEVAAIMFMDIVGFTTLSSTMDPNDVVKMLSRIFTTCDAIMAEHGLMKIKTIGDSYMAAAFGDTPTDVAERAARAALAMLHAVPSAGSPNGSHEVLHVRIGLHCGPVTAGVIGTERLQYDVWGDTVNVASRMESTGEAGRIHVSSSFALALNGEKAKGGKGERAKGGNGEKGERAKGRKGTINVIERGTIEIKGKGPMTTYWLEGT